MSDAIAALPVQLKLIKELLKDLNEAFPAGKVSSFLKGEKCVIQPDPHFCAYRALSGWWVCCTDYGTFHDNIQVIEEYCNYVTDELGVNCSPCHQHTSGAKMYKNYAHDNVGNISLFIGKISW